VSWGEILHALKNVVDVYDRMAVGITLGLDVRLRRMATSSVRGIVLDLGCGTGRLSAYSPTLRIKQPILLDPIEEMVRIASSRIPKADAVIGVAEYLPFRAKSVDFVMAGYSLRDVLNLPRALAQIFYVLKDGGELVVLDFWRSKNSLVLIVELFYLILVTALVSAVLAPRHLRYYLVMYKTLLRNPPLECLLEVLRKFGAVKRIKLALGFLNVVTVKLKRNPA